MLTRIEANCKSQLKFQSSFEMRVAINPLLLHQASFYFSDGGFKVENIFAARVYYAGISLHFAINNEIDWLENRTKIRVKFCPPVKNPLCLSVRQ